ncbi:MAG: GNAT family N-acetyltransferase [Patescibacteria group bacterium]|nr:GNAT family N-acetyltransferase [Patescibacteria group bacterium]
MNEANKIKFREFRKEDKEEIVKLMSALNREDSEELPLNRKKINELFRYAPKKQYVQIFVAEISGKIIGYSIYNKAFSVELSGLYGEIDEIYIKPLYRNRKIGTNFVNWVKNYSIKQKFKMLYLVTTLSNKRAQKFYKRLGFRKMPHLNFVLKLE